MKIRFIRVTPSENPDYPFLVGQIIDLPRLTREQQAWITSGVAEVLVEGAPEMAMLDAPAAQATEPRPKARGPR